MCKNNLENHHSKVGAAKPGQKFGKDFLYKQWKRACENLGIAGVDWYGGTNHSSAIALRKHFLPEQIKKAYMHSTTKAFERFFQIGADSLRDIYSVSGHQSTADQQKRWLQ